MGNSDDHFLEDWTHRGCYLLRADDDHEQVPFVDPLAGVQLNHERVTDGYPRRLFHGAGHEEERRAWLFTENRGLHHDRFDRARTKSWVDNRLLNGKSRQLN